MAITTWTLNSYRAYDIADEFRRRGVPVILGGPHTFFHAEEAGEHCDAVGIGEAEGIWTQMLEDALHGRLKKVYQADLLPRPRRPAPASLRTVEPATLWAFQDLHGFFVAGMSFPM